MTLYTFFLLTLTIFAQNPTVIVGGATSSGPNEMVVLSAQIKNPPQKIKLTKYNWLVYDDTNKVKVFVTEQGNEAAFNVGKPKNNKLTIVLDVNYLVDNDGIEGLVCPEPVFSEITVTKTNININNIVIPEPPPIFPEGKFKLAPFVYQKFMADTSLDKDTKVKLATLIANNLDGVSARIISTVPDSNDLEKIIQETRKVNDETLSKSGIDVAKTANLKNLIKSQVEKLSEEGKITSAADLFLIYKEISLGLKAVK